MAGCPASDDGEDDGAGSSGSAEEGSGTAGPSTQGATSTTDADSGSGSADAGSGSDDAATSSGSSSADGSSSGDDDGSDSGSTGAGLCTARPIGELDSAIAILVGDIPPPSGGGGTTVGTVGSDTGNDGGGGVPDDSLRIELANVTLTCEDPYIDYSCGPMQKWNLSFTLPVEMQAPGTYDLAELNFGYSVVEPGVGKDCAGGGGGGFGGTLIIDAIGPGGVIGCIDSPDLLDFDGNGSFEATMCGA